MLNIIFIKKRSSNILSTCLKVLEGNRIFDQGVAKVNNLFLIQFGFHKKITCSKCWSKPQTSTVYSLQCPGIFGSQTKKVCLIYTVYSTHYTMYHTKHSLAMKEKRHKRKFIWNFNVLCIWFGIENFIWTQLLFRLCQSHLSNKQTTNCTYITLYTGQCTLWTKQTRAQYIIN